MLKDQGVFAKLDRLSGTTLSVFYLNAGTKHAVEVFNARFLAALGVEEQAVLPCVVFFRVHTGRIEDVEIAQLDNADLIHGFSELYGAIKSYIAGQPPRPIESRIIKRSKTGGKFVSLEIFRAALKKALELTW